MLKPFCSEFRATVMLAAGLSAVALPCADALAQNGSLRINMPLGGWREGNADDAYTAPLNYPAVQPGIGANVSSASQIRGRISGTPKDRAPATLIINGSAMPLAIHEDGSFARPYAFNSGSNSVQINTPDGARKRLQFYQTTGNSPRVRLRIVLNWDTDGTDLDMHVLTPDGNHAWYGQRVIPGGAIDLDVTTGYGPEIFSAPAPQSGPYQVYVNYYGSGDAQTITTARLTVITEEGTPNERRQEFAVPLRKPGELTLVKRFMYP